MAAPKTAHRSNTTIAAPSSASAGATRARQASSAQSRASSGSTHVATARASRPIEVVHIDSDDSDLEVLEPAAVTTERASVAPTVAPNLPSSTKAATNRSNEPSHDTSVDFKATPTRGDMAKGGSKRKRVAPSAGAIRPPKRRASSSAAKENTVQDDTKNGHSGNDMDVEDVMIVEDDDDSVHETAGSLQVERRPLFRAETQDPTVSAAPSMSRQSSSRSHQAATDADVVQGSSKDLDRSGKDDGAQCPVCSQPLATLSNKKREAHVNACLDSGGSSKPSKGGFFAPLSSLFGSRSSKSDSKAPVQLSASSVSTKKRQPTPETARKPLSILPSFSLPTAQTMTPSMPNAFTALMSGNIETKQWQEAEAADKRKGRLPKGEVKQVPFYKWIEGMEITVDAFRYDKIEGCKAYFLSHAHYQQMNERWCHGPIYCSVTTANLIKLKLKVKDEWVHPLPMDQTVKVHGIDVTLIDANHCPGSVLFLFEGPHTDPKSSWSKTPKRIFRYLHCGDFRASPQHINHPALKGKKIDAVYLDTTYLDPKYCFPPQELVIDACAQLVRERVLDGNEDALHRTGGEQHVKQIDAMKGWLREGKMKKEEVQDVDVKKLFGAIKDEIKAEQDDAGCDEDDAGCDEANLEGELDEGDVKNDFDDDAEAALLECEGLNDGGEADLAVPVENEAVGDEMDLGADETPVPESGDGTPKSELEDEALPYEVTDDSEALPVGRLDDKPDVKDDKDDKLNERFLVVVGTYSIGKERIVKGIARALQTKVYCDERKLSIMLAQDDPELHGMMTRDPLEAQVHMVWLQEIKGDSLADYLGKYHAKHVEGGFTRLIGLRPTGWTYKSESKEKVPAISKILDREKRRTFTSAGLYPQRDSTWRCMAFGCPYSEHSSFYELTCFALSLDYVKMIPTVNVHNANSRAKMKDWMTRWMQEKKKRADARIPRMVPPRSPLYW
ncbi:hypothetical protein ACM66B_002959 [Microbotryomycetes sp. NB124-2]